MSDWLKELGSNKFSEKELNFVVNVLKLAYDDINGLDDDDKQKFFQMMDNVIYNVTELKKLVEEKL